MTTTFPEDKNPESSKKVLNLGDEMMEMERKAGEATVRAMKQVGEKLRAQGIDPKTRKPLKK